MKHPYIHISRSDLVILYQAKLLHGWCLDLQSVSVYRNQFPYDDIFVLYRLVALRTLNERGRKVLVPQVKAICVHDVLFVARQNAHIIKVMEVCLTDRTALVRLQWERLVVYCLKSVRAEFFQPMRIYGGSTLNNGGKFTGTVKLSPDQVHELFNIRLRPLHFAIEHGFFHLLSRNIVFVRS